MPEGTIKTSYAAAREISRSVVHAVIFVFKRFGRSLGVGCLMLVGCQTTPRGSQDLLDLLKNGVSRREDVQLKLGVPSAEYEESRILAYRLGKGKGGYIVVGRAKDWRDAPYRLVL